MYRMCDKKQDGTKETDHKNARQGPIFMYEVQFVTYFVVGEEKKGEENFLNKQHIKINACNNCNCISNGQTDCFCWVCSDVTMTNENDRSFHCLCLFDFDFFIFVLINCIEQYAS